MTNLAGLLQGVRIEGTVELQSPLLIGAGESDGIIDTLVLKNKQGQPFIPGTSLAGVLRAIALREDPVLAGLLFGEIKKKKSDNEVAVMEEKIEKVNELDKQSAVCVEDIILSNARIVLRDGIEIDGLTGVGIAGHKYDYEVVERGARGVLRIRVLLRGYHEPRLPEIKVFIERMADRLMAGIALGALTTKGFGRLRGAAIRACIYDFRELSAVKAWLLEKESAVVYRATSTACEENGGDFVLQSAFSLKGALLVRAVNDNKATQCKNDSSIAYAQMKSNEDFLIPGTTLKGVLRKQAERVLRKIGKNKELLQSLMGYSTEDKKVKSRLYVEEMYFKQGAREAAQARTRIDRFTGGVAKGALVTNVPIWRNDSDDPKICLKLRIKDCEAWEAGLMLFLLKDLWTGRLMIGGEKSIGRGRLQGLSATIQYKQMRVVIDGSEEFQVGEGRDQLEAWARALQEKVGDQA